MLLQVFSEGLVLVRVGEEDLDSIRGIFSGRRYHQLHPF